MTACITHIARTTLYTQHNETNRVAVAQKCQPRHSHILLSCEEQPQPNRPMYVFPFRGGCARSVHRSIGCSSSWSFVIDVVSGGCEACILTVALSHVTRQVCSAKHVVFLFLLLFIFGIVGLLNMKVWGNIGGTCSQLDLMGFGLSVD